ncbi:MAG: PAS domain S-box protein, partial [Halobacteriota archaeon]
MNEPRSDGSIERFETVSAFLSAFSDAALLTDADGIILAVNDAAVKRFSTSAAALVGTSAYDTPPADAPQARRKWMTEVVSSGAPMHAEELCEGRRFRVSLYPVATRNGSVTRVLMLKHDVTEERDVIDEQQRLALLDVANDGIIIFDLDGHIRYWNKGAERQYGWKQDDLRGELIHSLLQTVFPSPLEDITDHLFRAGRWEGELRHTTRAGVVVTVMSHWTLQYGARNVPEAILETARDITEQKQAEEKLRAASLYARSLIEASLDPLVTINADGKITDVNKATEEVTGLSREELIESDFSNYFTEPEKANVGYRQVFTDGFVRDYPLAIRHKSGRITDVLYNATLFKNELDEIQGVFAAARDITERKQAEHQLKEHAQRTSVLNDIIHVINEASDLPTLFGQALPTTIERLGFAAGFIATENEAGRLQVRYAHNLPQTFVESLDLIEIDANPYVRGVHRKGKPVVVDELSADTLAARCGIKGSAVSLPVFSEGDFIGEFTLYAMRPHLFTLEERSLLLTIATEFGTALSKLEAQDAARHYAEELAQYSAHLEELVEERTAQLKDAERLAGIGETAAMIGHDLRNPLQGLQYIVDLQRLRFERMSP